MSALSSMYWRRLTRTIYLYINTHIYIPIPIYIYLSIYLSISTYTLSCQPFLSFHIYVDHARSRWARCFDRSWRERYIYIYTSICISLSMYIYIHILSIHPLFLGDARSRWARCFDRGRRERYLCISFYLSLYVYAYTYIHFISSFFLLIFRWCTFALNLTCWRKLTRTSGWSRCTTRFKTTRTFTLWWSALLMNEARLSHSPFWGPSEAVFFLIQRPSG